MNTENLSIWCWLIPLLCTLIGAIIGYLIGKGKRSVEYTSDDMRELMDKNAKLEADLNECRKMRAAAKTEMPQPTPPKVDTASAIAFDAAAAKGAFGKPIKQDDLKVVEGIGPKIEGMFKAGGISTWKALAEASVADCQKILDTGGDRYKVHNPESWPLQAKMAYEGEWVKLAKWQDEHSHGRL